MSAKSVFILTCEYLLSQVLVLCLGLIYVDGIPIAYKLVPNVNGAPFGLFTEFVMYFATPIFFIVFLNFAYYTYTKKLIHKTQINLPFLTAKNLLVSEVMILTLTAFAQLLIYFISFFPEIGVFSALYSIVNTIIIFRLLFLSPIGLILAYRLFYHFTNLTAKYSLSTKILIEAMFVLASFIVGLYPAYMFNSWLPDYNITQFLQKDWQIPLLFSVFYYVSTRVWIMAATLLFVSVKNKVVFEKYLNGKIIACAVSVVFVVFMLFYRPSEYSTFINVLALAFQIFYNSIFLSILFIVCNIRSLRELQKKSI
jgi:hypothetical protein